VLGEAITWLEIHGDRPDAVAHWRALQAEPHEHPLSSTAEPGNTLAPYPRRRRRRRRRSGAPRLTNGS
jgi:anti-sigma factor RsiW